MKVALCSPVHGDTRARFTAALANLLIHTAKAAPHIDLGYFMQRSSSLPHNRTLLARNALEWGAESLLWLDVDHTFPPDALIRLLSHRLPFVGANYGRRNSPSAPTAMIADRPVWTTPELAQAGEIQTVETLGFGLCLTSAAVFRAVEKPWFAVEPAPEDDFISEDAYFCRKARDAGFEINVDHALSWNVGHVTESVVMNAHTLRERERWEAANPPA